jgi:cold-inducible RNA-binding protein
MVFQEAQVAKKLYVGNLPYGITSSDLERVFQEHGTVESAQVITDRDTGRSKGFGFVEMRNSAEADAAVQALNGQDFNGRALTVNEARPREDRGGGRREVGGERAKSGYGGGKRW